MPMADDDGLISGLTEEQLITNEEMDGLVKEVRRRRARNPGWSEAPERARDFRLDSGTRRRDHEGPERPRDSRRPRATSGSSF